MTYIVTQIRSKKGKHLYEQEVCQEKSHIHL